MIWISSPIDSTATIGQILASDRMPNPSTADTALPTPRPMARTRGTVTGPVVTPALSHATLTNSSVENIVSVTPTRYKGSSTFIRSKPITTFAMPSAIPTATPPAGGVAVGIALGIAKVVIGFDLMKVLLPLYLVGVTLTIFSTEEFVNVAWDSAGVTTGPVTVPLVLAMGLGVGNAVSAVEGFGILSLASICPIVAVLSMGLLIQIMNKRSVNEQSS